jgi:hypothetical protein
VINIALVEQQPNPPEHPQAPQPAAAPSPPAPVEDRMWARRLREDARRPLSKNLAEGIALSHVLVRYASEPPRA